MEQVIYGEAFKRRVVGEIERGELSQSGAALKYGIGGTMTVVKWLRKYGGPNALGTATRIDMDNSPDEKSQLQREKQSLESALAQAHLKILALEELINVAEKTYQVPIKKNSGGKRLTDFTGAKASASPLLVDASDTADKASTSGDA